METRIELHAKTKYSLDHESTLDIKNLILKCASNGEPGVAIVDTDSVVSFYKARKILKELNLPNFKLIYGVELKAIYNNNLYKVVTLIKNKKGLSSLYRTISPYHTTKKIFLDELTLNRKNYLIGLIYEENNYNPDILKYFDYVEVNKNTPKEIITNLKKQTTVIYSNQINALSDEEILSKQIIYHQLNIKDNRENRIYQNTKEILKEINDKEIVIDNPNKIFNMIEDFELIDDKQLMPKNNDFDIGLEVYINLNKKYGDNIPEKIRKRVDQELKLISDYHYEGYLSLYKKIIDKCKESNEEYVIYDYINYLYIAYILGITHFNPLKLNLNNDIFFCHHPSINIKISNNFYKELNDYIKKELSIKTIKCKSIMNLNNSTLNKTIIDYEEKHHLKLTSKEKTSIKKYLSKYPINNHAITNKELIIPDEYNIFEITPRELLSNGNIYDRFTHVDYKDIKDLFITLELIPNEIVENLNELKTLTRDYIKNNNYKDKNIINTKEFKTYLKEYQNNLILDDLYNDLTNSNLDYVEIFTIINEIRNTKKISKNTKDLLDKNNLKLKQHKNINFINRGILNERIRLVYELLYFKHYYNIEYYYVILKDNLSLFIIDILKKGYNEVINKIKDYNKYNYEYKYLILLKELYQSNINFLIEKRPLLEDYHLELDIENNQITLILNETKEEIDKYKLSNLSLMGTRPINGKMSHLSKTIYTLLNNNTKVTLFSLSANTNYYLEYLLNIITGIDRHILHQYLNPCSCNKHKILSLNHQEYINGLEYLLYHDLDIKDKYELDSMIIDKTNTLLDKIIYTINNSNSQIIFIDNIEYLGNDLENILSKFKEMSKEKNIHFIIYTNLKREYEETSKKDISSFPNNDIYNKYIDYITILDKDNLYIVKELS